EAEDRVLPEARREDARDRAELAPGLLEPRDAAGAVDARVQHADRAGDEGVGGDALLREIAERAHLMGAERRAAAEDEDPLRHQLITPACFQRSRSSHEHPCSSNTSSVCAPASQAAERTTGGWPSNWPGLAHRRTGPSAVSASRKKPFACTCGSSARSAGVWNGPQMHSDARSLASQYARGWVEKKPTSSSRIAAAALKRASAVGYRVSRSSRPTVAANRGQKRSACSIMRTRPLPSWQKYVPTSGF